MASTFDELLATRTQATEEALLLSSFQGQSFPISDWSVGGVARTMVKAISSLFADLSVLVKSVTSGGLVQLAKDLKKSDGTEERAWLDLLALHFYDLARVEATFTVERCTLTCAAGNGPINITSGFISQASGGNRYIYQGTSTVVVPDSGTNTIDLTAESPGAKYQDPAGSIQTVVTALPGLTINNPSPSFGGLNSAGQATKSSTNAGTGTVTPSGAPVLTRQFIITVLVSGSAGSSGQVLIEAIEAGVRSTLGTPTIPTSFSAGDGITLTLANGAGAGFIAGDVHTFQTPGSPIIQQGADTETNAQLAARCIGRWPSLSPNAVADKYVQMIRQASLDGGYGIEKITVQASATIAGIAEILTATVSGAPSSPTVAALQAYVDARSGITEKANVSGAVNKNITLSGQVTVRNADIVTVKSAADIAWALYVKGLPIGGDRKTGFPGVVRLQELTQAVMDAGAIDVSALQLNGAAVNLALLYNEVAVIPAGQEPSNALTWNPVAG